MKRLYMKEMPFLYLFDSQKGKCDTYWKTAFVQHIKNSVIWLDANMQLTGQTYQALSATDFNRTELHLTTYAFKPIFFCNEQEKNRIQQPSVK